MNKFARTVASISVVAILSSLVVSTAFAGTFGDVAADAYYYTAVEQLATDGVLDASKENFMPAALFQRDQAAKLVVLGAGVTPLENPETASFTDVPKTAWSYQYVETAAAHQIVGGYAHKPGYFGPGDPVTREQYAKMMVEAYGWDLVEPATPHFTDVPATSAMYGYVETAYHWSVVNGMTATTFSPTANITRADAALMTYRAKYEAEERDEAGDDDDDDDDGDLEGGAGSLEDFQLIASYNNEGVGEGSEDVKVYGVEIEADDSSDLGFTAFTLDFDQGTADRDFEKYATEVSIWFDGEEIARVDADTFTDDNLYRKTVSFDDMAIVRSGEKEKFYVAVSGISNLDSGDEGETWDLAVDGVRFQDGQGAIMTDTTTGDLTTVVTFSFESFASAANTELKISAGDEDINNAHVIDVSSSGETDDVEILSFEVEVKGDSDLTVDDLVVEFTLLNSTTATDLNDIASTVYLSMDGEVVGTENATTDETVTFDNIDLTLEAGETYEFLVLVDILEYDAAGTYDEGDTLGAKITVTERNLWDVEDEEGEDLANAERTGAVTGDEHAFYDEGIMVELVSTTKTKSYSADAAAAPDSDSGTFEIDFSVTAFGDDQYIDKSTIHNNTSNLVATDPATAAGEGVRYDVFKDGADTSTDSAGPAGTYDLSGVLLTSSISKTQDGTAAYYIAEGTTRQFTLTVVITPDVEAGNDDSGQYELRLDGINWGNVDGDTDDATNNVYNFNMSEFKTGNLYLKEIM